MITDKTELSEYQEWVHSTSCKAGADWASMGLAAEAGEVVALFEKAIRKDTPVDVTMVMDELGDVLWYLAEVCNSIDIDLDEVMIHNIQKINERRSNKVQ